jgi:hypothetical protein
MQIDTTKLNVGEVELLQWQFGGDLGNFKTALWKAITHSDSGNLDRLGLGFPDQVEAFRKFGQAAGYWQDVLMRAGLVTPQPAANEPPPVEGAVMPKAPPGKPYDH